MNPRKLLPSDENPIDDLLYYFIKIISPIFHNLNFTPNMITTISLIFTLLFIKNFYINKIILAALFYFFSYFFDCLDGYNARKYNMVSKFGDYYDHITDIFGIVSFYYILFIKKKYKFILISLFFAFLFLIHMGCQEKININSKSESLTFLKKLCLNKKNIKYSRWVGCGTYTLINILIILLNDKY